MRIAVISNTSWYLFNFRLNLMRSLQEAGHIVVAIASQSPHAERIQQAGILFEEAHISGDGTNPFIELLSVISLWRILRRKRIDLVLSYTPKGNLYSALACMASGVPYVPNVSGLGRAFISKSVVTWVAQFLYQLTFRRAKRVFFQNQDDLKIFINRGLVNADMAERIPGSGVDLSHFTPVRPPDRPTQAPVFLLVARLMWDKGVGEYVQAAREVLKLYPEACFQLLGFVDVANPSAISREQVQTWVNEGVIQYLGSTDDVRPFLSHADAVVLPSYREGVPRTLLEAAAMTRPIITTDAPGCRDTVIDGETGYLCQPHNAQDLANKLLQFIALTSTERAAMGQRGLAYVKKHFDEQVVIKRYMGVVREIADNTSISQ